MSTVIVTLKFSQQLQLHFKFSTCSNGCASGERATMVNRSPGTSLIVKNLCYHTVAEPQLKAIFAAYGEVISVNIMRDENGKSQGFGS